ncbi:P-loop NTPase fold protein [Saccharicrinis aurantiacus]|uniref:P-loop NTPase fold protein n=1 Tax=Saccharicrinis aurantiacus TaxID=1849719 RepID=UPI00094F996F|nr:P-loop NTPase fold protein [Saccharicrinis aurantiacus]
MTNKQDNIIFQILTECNERGFYAPPGKDEPIEKKSAVEFAAKEGYLKEENSHRYTITKKGLQILELGSVSKYLEYLASSEVSNINTTTNYIESDKAARLKDFKEKWPEEVVQNMKLDMYCGSKEYPEYFCYDLEVGYSDLGGIRGGSSFKFGIYKRKGPKAVSKKYKHDKEYSWLGYLSNGNSPQEAMLTVSMLIKEIINKAKSNQLEEIDKIRIHQFVKWKIAFIYAPDNVLSIYSRNALVYLSNNRGANFGNKTPISKMHSFLIQKMPKGANIIDYGEELWHEYSDSSSYEGSPHGRRNKTLASDSSESAGELKEENKEAEEAEEELNFAELFHGFNYFRSDKIEPVFNVPVIAKEFARLLESMQREEGQMVGVFGQWGRGKTYFIKYLCSLFNINYDTGKKLDKKKKDKPFHFVKFHAWKYQDTEAVWAYLYECLSSKYLGSNYFGRILNTIWLQSIRHIPNTFITLVFALFVIIPCLYLLYKYEVVPSEVTEIIPELLSALLGTFGLTLMYIYNKYGLKATTIIKRYTQGVSFKETLGLQAEIQNEIVFLLNAWYYKYDNFILRRFFSKPPRVLLFVDDLDRCGVDKMVHVIDALRVMLEEQTIIKRMLILVAVDQDKLKFAIKNKYFDNLNNILKDNKLEDKLVQLEKEYMDKLFISGIQLSTLSSKERMDYFGALTKDRVETKELESQNDFVSEGKVKKGIVDLDSNREKNTKMEVSDSGNTPNLIEITDKSLNSTESPNKANNESFELSIYEKEVLDKAIKRMNSATPRQIRIYYYRYLLAKNILSRLDTEPLKEEEVEYLSQALNGQAKLKGEPYNERTGKVVQLVVTY